MNNKNYATSNPEEIANRKFKLNDVVRVIGRGPDQYKILVFREHEPCCQIEFTEGTLKRLEWMITDELELAGA